jgi:hypothetical protein
VRQEAAVLAAAGVRVFPAVQAASEEAAAEQRVLRPQQRVLADTEAVGPCSRLEQQAAAAWGLVVLFLFTVAC